MIGYFRKFDTEEAYEPSPAVLEQTKVLAQSREYELGYWMQAFMRFYSPGLYFRATDALGEVSNWMELRYLMEHAIFDPTHPLHNLDYEECSAEDRTRLDVFLEIARTCCYCGYAIVKTFRPNQLPKKERKSLTQMERKSIRWMIAYYTNSGTAQERTAFSNYKYKFRCIYPQQKPTQEEIDAFNEYQDEIYRQTKIEHRKEARRREAERVSKLPKITYIAAYPCIKEQFREVFGKDDKFVVIHHLFELGDLNFRGKLPSTQELVVILINDVGSQLLLRYITDHFHGKISVIYISGKENDSFPLAFTNLELRESCKKKIELSKAQIIMLRDEFRLLKSNSSDFFMLENSKICRLPRVDVYNHILRQFPEEEISVFDLLGNCLGHAPTRWSQSSSFYFCCIEELVEADVIIVTDQSEPYGRRQMPLKWKMKLAEKYLKNRKIDIEIERIKWK